MDQAYCLYCMSRLENGICPNRCSPVFQNELYMLQPGFVLDGRYLVGRSLGQGGFGITYLGRNLVLDIPVAIKEFFPSGIATRNAARSSQVEVTGNANREQMTREANKFLSEARSLARFLDEPGIVHVMDFFAANDTAYIVMEYIRGETLKDYQLRMGRLSLDYVLTLFDPIVRSLSRIHAEGFVHRDVSPDNIMITPEGSAKLLDFGTVRTVSLAGEHSMSVILKPGFAPEEQYRRKGGRGPWTDVYSLAATIYRCITGDTPEDAFQRLYQDNLKRPSELGVSIRRSQEAALMKGLAVRSSDRYQTVQEFVSGLSGQSASGLDTIPLGTDPLDAESESGTGGGHAQTVPLFQKGVRREQGTEKMAGPLLRGDRGRPFVNRGAHGGEGSRNRFGGGPGSAHEGYRDPNQRLQPGQRQSRPEKGGLGAAKWLSIAAVVILAVALVLFHPWSRGTASGSSGDTGGDTSTELNGKGSSAEPKKERITTEMLASYAGTEDSITLSQKIVPAEAFETFSEMENLTELELISCEIQDVEALRKMTRLTSLTLSDCGLRDISFLSDLPNLSSLSLSYNAIETLEPLAGLTSLSSLDLRNSWVRDLTPLSGLTSLTSLNVGDNWIDSLEPIAGLTRLTALDVHNDHISDLAPISGLSGLTSLNIGENRFESLAPVIGLTGLVTLDIHNTNISSLDFASGFTNLTALDCSGNAISSLDPISGLSRLAVLNISDNAVSSLESLSGLTNLTSLDISRNIISDIGMLSGLRNLTELNISYNNIGSVECVSGFTDLKSLNICGNAISSLEPLSGLTGLTSLDISSNHVSSLEPLSGLRGLTSLNIGFNEISSLEPVAGLTGLEDLRIQLTKVTDLSPVERLDSLQSLHISSDQEAYLGSLADKQGLNIVSD